MFKAGQLVGSPSGELFGWVTEAPEIHPNVVRVRLLNGKSAGLEGYVYADTINLIGNNYQPKTNTPAR